MRKERPCSLTSLAISQTGFEECDRVTQNHVVMSLASVPGDSETKLETRPETV